MGSNKWTETTLGKEADLITGFPFKSKNYTDSSNSVKLLRGDNIAQGVLRWENAKLWPHEQLDDLTEYQLKEHDVVLAMDRPWIEAGLKYACIRDGDLPAMLVQRVARLRGGERLQTRFIYYLIGSYNFTNYVLSIQTGTAVPHISSQQIRAFPFLLPSSDEQNKIVQILASLDDKIELNRQMNQTLEAMAQAIFQSWFVDFEPVKAKQKAKAAGKSAAEIEMAAIVALSGKSEEAIRELGEEVRSGLAEMAGLFSDELVESELGLIPEGWEWKLTSQLFEVKDGTHESPKRQEKGFYLVTSKHIKNGSIDYSSAYRISREDYDDANKRSLVERFDIILTMIGTVGVPLIVLESQIKFAIKNVGLFKTSANKEIAFYFYLLLCGSGMQNLLDARTAGTTQQYISLKELRSIPLKYPGIRILKGFTNIVEPLFELLYQNEQQSQILAELRNSLLPKLLSGELTLPTAQTQATEALD
jgi:type I restriction enzyme, S subunit